MLSITRESRRMFFPLMTSLPVMNSGSSPSKTNQTGATCGPPDRCWAGAPHEPAAARDRGNESGAATRIGWKSFLADKDELNNTGGGPARMSSNTASLPGRP